MNSQYLKHHARETHIDERRPVDTWITEITRRFKASGIALPIRLCCESDQAFLSRVARRFPEAAVGYPGLPEH